MYENLIFSFPVSEEDEADPDGEASEPDLLQADKSNVMARAKIHIDPFFPENTLNFLL